MLKLKARLINNELKDAIKLRKAVQRSESGDY